MLGSDRRESSFGGESIVQVRAQVEALLKYEILTEKTTCGELAFSSE